MEVLSYCLMRNHIHLIVIPDTEKSLSQGIGMIHRDYSRMINFREQTRGFLFQGRFFSCPMDNNYLVEAIKYVELNPVRAGICDHVFEYVWSSAKYHLGLDSTNPVVKDRGWYGTIEDWEQLLKAPFSDLELLRKHFRTGRPLGSKEFLINAEKLTRRELIPKKAGRKLKHSKQVSCPLILNRFRVP